MMAFLMDFNFTCIDSVCWLKLSGCFICRVQSVNMLAAITRLPVPDLLNLYHIVYESMTWYIYMIYTYMYHMNLFNNHNHNHHSPIQRRSLAPRIRSTDPWCQAVPKLDLKRAAPQTAPEQLVQMRRQRWWGVWNGEWSVLDSFGVFLVKTQFGNDLLEFDVLNFRLASR